MDLRLNVVAVSLLGMFLFGQLADARDEATEAEYKERLSRYDVVKDPEDHKRIASWCKRSYPSKFQYHQNAYNVHVFSEEVAKLPKEPTANNYKVLEEKALKLELPDEAQEYLGKWGEVQYADFAKRLKPGDVKMMKQLAEWCDKNKIGFISSAQTLAAEILTHDESYMLSRKLLDHIEWKGKWMHLKDAIASIDIKDLPERIALHKAAAKVRNQEERSYPTNPFKGMEQLEQHYLFSPRKSPGAQFYLVENGYSRSKPTRLVLSLHGGGSGGFEKAKEYAGFSVPSWKRHGEKEIVLIPIATNHVSFSWIDLSNVLEILNAMEELCERFNIDRKKIYVTGQSMGGGGAGSWYLAFPEFAAASCGRAGGFVVSKLQPDVMKKPLMLIQGDKEEEKRIVSQSKFVKLAEKCNGNVTTIILPGVDHFIKDQECFPLFLPFFEKHTNDLEPDFDIIRAAARKWFK